MKRVSRCGTDIGGAPTLALPYTLARCWPASSASPHTSHWPLTEEASKGLGFWDAGALQQRQGPAASAEKHKRVCTRSPPLS